MRAVLVPPPLIAKQRDGKLEAYPPLGVLSMATVARQNGHDVTICDLNVARCRGVLPHSEDWHAAAADHILALGPDIVGFGTICSSFPASIMIVKALKALRPALTILMGGPQASLVYGDLLLSIPEVDFVLTGEADYTFMRFMESYSHGQPPEIPGMARRERGKLQCDQADSLVDLDSLPMCDYTLWPMQEAVKNGWFEGGIPLDAGRGCPYQCSFCSTNKFFRRKYRIKSAARLKEEIQQLYQCFGYTRYRLTHDSFTANRKDVVEISRALAECDVPNLSWSCSARVDAMDSELMEIMWKGGCRGLFFGVETGSSRMQDVINKNLDIEALEPVLSNALALGYRFVISCIIGFPEEEWTDVEATLRFLLRWSNMKKVNLQLHLLAPQTGTEILEKYKNQLQFDYWYPDVAYFNTLCPKPEIAFVKDHSELCPQCYFIPNQHVDRRELTITREFIRLLMRSLPGLGPFVLRTQSSILDLLRRWRRRCAVEGLPVPDRTSFFWLVPDDTIPYLKNLMEVLGENPHLTETHESFLSLWKTILALEEAPAVLDTGEPTRIPDASRSTNRDVDGFRVVTRNCQLTAFEFDVYQCLQDWMERGVWNMPISRRTYYLFVKHENGLQVCELSRVAAMIFRWCDGNHTLSDLYFLVDALSDAETESLRQEMGTAAITHSVLKFLRDAAGLKIKPTRRGSCTHVRWSIGTANQMRRASIPARINISHLPKDVKISRQEMKNVRWRR